MADTAGERVREARTRKGWSQGELSRQTGLRTETISRIETGKHGLGQDAATAIAEAIGVSIDWLVRGDPTAIPATDDALQAFLTEAGSQVSPEERATLESVAFYGLRPTKITYSMIWGALKTCAPA